MTPASVSFREAARVWARIGVFSFGGPAGQIALMHKELVEERRWISEPRFLHALNYCMLLPGPEAQQLATYIGWLLHRTAGGLVAGLLFVAPGFVTIMALSVLYATSRDVPAVAAVFFGLKAAVLAVVVEAVIRIGKRALKSPLLYGAAIAAFVAIRLFAAPFPAVVFGAALVGALAARWFPGQLPVNKSAEAEAAGSFVIDDLFAHGELAHTLPSRGRAVRVLAVGLVLWVAPIALLDLGLGTNHVLALEAVFFGKAAVVTFGGAYAVLAYVAQRAVETYGWLRPGEMLDGLGLAETTPGPLIMVVQFVGFMGAFRQPGALPPILAGIAGSVVTVWVTFAPCFLWIFLGGPYIERLRKSRALHGALSVVTAAVVGVIASLSLWFFVNTLFAHVDDRKLGPLHLLVPRLATIDIAALVLATGAALALLRFKIGLGKTLAASALLGAAWKLLAT